ncbi:hypothetical protein EDC01DRAFT_777218 [Geopyxis carbonaria]|nr:hypothetical protein EDC01DRAFT_777218 [Geopyxis carbonaria]
MGSLCGKESPPSHGPGRVLGSAPPSNNGTARIPAAASRTNNKPPKVTGPGRTLGAGSTAEEDPRAAAARAAEARNAKTAAGKLGSQLDGQKRKTQSQHLAEAAKGKGGQANPLVWD